MDVGTGADLTVVRASTPTLEVVQDDNGDPGRLAHLGLCALLLRPGVTVNDAITQSEALQGLVWYAMPAAGATLYALPSPYDAEDVRLLFAVRRQTVEPRDWQRFLRSAGVPLAADAGRDQESVVIAVKTLGGADERTVLWCFGQMSRSISTTCTDNRFGLIVALNQHEGGTALTPWRELPPEQPRRRTRGDPSARVRGMSSFVRDGYPHRASLRSLSAAPVDGLRFDDVSDLVRSLSLRTGDELLGDMEGGRTLRFSTYLSRLGDLVDLTDHVVALRGRDDYRREWDWVDRILPVEDEAEVDDVFHELFDHIVGDDDVKADLLMPPIPSVEDTSARVLRYALPGEHRPMRQSITWDELRQWLRQNSHIPGTDILRRNVRVELEGHEAGRRQSFPLHHLLAAEIEVGGQLYVLNDGEVLRVESSFLRNLDASLEAAVPWSSFPFPDFEGGTEPSYLENARRRSDDRLLMLDETPIRLPGETPFEVCDLFSDDRRLVFAKLKGRSSLFSHLAVQAETAAELLRRSEPARDAFLERVAQAAPTPAMTNAAAEVARLLHAGRPEQVTITLLLLGSWRKRSLTALPLVSRLRLRRTAQRITALGYAFEMAAPPLHRGHLTPRRQLDPMR